MIAARRRLRPGALVYYFTGVSMILEEGILVQCWDDYKIWVSQLIKSDEKYYFRGQRKPEWKLQTSFHRCSELTGISLNDYMKVIIPEVHYQVSSSEGAVADLRDIWQLGSFLARLQHHGFPTPLLDWTLSPYIAAFFAFKDIDPYRPDTDYVTINIFDMGKWAGRYAQTVDFFSPSFFVSGFRPLATNNHRMIRQMAVTTATNIPDLAKYLLAQPDHYLYQIQLPSSERHSVMSELALMGITSMTMFPDFDGVCSFLKEVYFNKVDVKQFMPMPPSSDGV